METTNEGLISVREAARRLGLTEGSLRVWMCRGRVEYVKIGGGSRFRPETVDKLIRDGIRPAKGAAS